MVFDLYHNLHKDLSFDVNTLIVVVGHLLHIGNNAPLLHYTKDSRLISDSLGSSKKFGC